MSTVAEKSADLAVPEWAPSDSVDEKVDRYLAARLKAIGADYRSVAITTFLLASAVGLVLWLGAGVVADHWLVPGGLDRTLRMAWLAVAAAAVVAAAIKWVVPLVRYRVNLVYAARSIERANPELRNDVVNTVLVRARPQRIPAMVVTSLERRTAKRLSKLPADIVADRGPALRLAVVLAILVGLACLYAVLSPKSLGTSLARLVAPWSRVAPPTRVMIGEPELGWRLPAGERGGADAFHAIPVKDGRATIIRNRQLVVRSRIRGMAAGEEPPMVEVAGIAEDGTIDRATGWRSRMEPAVSSAAGGGFETTLPGGGHGLSNDLLVSVTAGDARSEPVRIVVVDAPSLLVKQIKLVPPSYTRREPEILEWQGDVSGLEGTKVTLLAESKDPLEMAAIDFGCDGQGLVKLKVDARDLARASGSFDLRLSADRSGPWERNYRLVFRPRGVADEDGRERGIEHRINVVADTMPEVRVVEPAKPVVKVPPEKPVAVGVEAVDPDFALRSVAIELELERDGERMPRPAQTILEREFAGPFRGQAVFKPSSVGGQAGDRLHYRAVAVDTKSPAANAARTEWFTFELDAGAPPRAVPQDRQPGNQDGQQGKTPQASGDGQGDGSKGSNGGKSGTSDASNGGQDGGKQNAAGAGSSGGGEQAKNSGEQPQQGSGGQGAGPPEKGSQGARSQGGGGSSDGSSEPSKQASGSSGGEGKTPAGEQQGGEQQGGGGQKDGGGANGGQQGGQQEGSQQQNGQQQNGGKQGGEQGRGEQKGQPQNGGKADGGSGRERSGEKGSPADMSNASDPQVASDGTNDGEAIERILEERAKDGAKEGSGRRDGASGPKGDRESGDRNEGSQQTGGGEELGRKEGDGKAGGQQGGEGHEKAGEKQPGEGKQPGGKSAGGNGEQGDAKQDQGRQQGGSGQGGGSSGGGGESKGDGKQEGKGEGKQDGQGAGDRAGDRGPGESGASQNAGSQTQKPGGSQQAGGGNSGDGKSGGAKPGDSEVGRPGEDLDNDDPQAERKPSEEAGAGGRAGRGLGGSDAVDGGKPPVGQAASREADWGEENLSHARNAVDLAVEHLKRSMDEGRSDVLDSLGWTREQAQAFLDRWARMAKDAKEGGPRKQRDFDRAVRSLGLTPSGVSRSRETVEQSRVNQAEGRRSQPPPEYREQFRAFNRGLRPDGG